ncbi:MULTISPECIES: OsmC family protein [Pedobacter]|uniref:OsmC family protein n=1 Tax=Pedobacter heparinus (strain ATCC 13125 / DSM 2366 / CIP 104194 / JCM 7457 / NBRC 12017 / NCIMB 9290 / NRRL B-14731 / HIM 762-3) TaxID=485917 RepID=C6Y0E7_PEDHD|nr:MULTISPECIES: OsmC family protein [Pedobacter]ACU04859.1 OsmC family protein [Pedobacter heparinus DSM 2366]MBB5437927.1 putative redox protein [Pedobacter sp. AK017]
MTGNQITAITELDRSHYKTKVYSGGHFIYSDEPEDLGGTDEGMAPAALLLASLGSCTAITIRMYADRKNLKLDHIKIELAICKEEEMNKETTISRKIIFTGDLTEDERKRLLVIADKCPIHKILSNPIKIETS